MILTKEATREQPPSSPRTPFLDSFWIADHSGGDAICKHKRVFQDL